LKELIDQKETLKKVIFTVKEPKGLVKRYGIKEEKNAVTSSWVAIQKTYSFLSLFDNCRDGLLISEVDP